MLKFGLMLSQAIRKHVSLQLGLKWVAAASKYVQASLGKHVCKTFVPYLFTSARHDKAKQAHMRVSRTLWWRNRMQVCPCLM